MNIPINFEKIEGVEFTVDGNDYYIEADNMEKGDIWLYRDGPYSSFSPLCFDIDWEKETWDLIKCEPGNGRNGNVLATRIPLTKHLMRDMDLFINHFLKDTIRTLIKNKSI